MHAGILASSSHYTGTGTMAGSVTDGVAAVERALAILDAFTDQDSELTLAELAKRTKMYKSTILRLARSLESCGYLMRAEDGTFRLGSRLLAARFAVPAAPQHGGHRPVRAAGDRGRTQGRRVLLRPRRRQEALPASRRRHPFGPRLDPRRRPPAAQRGRRRSRHLRIQRRQWRQLCAVRADMHAVSFGERDPEVAAVACPGVRPRPATGRCTGGVRAALPDRSGRREAHPAGAAEACVPAHVALGGQLRTLGSHASALATPGARRRPNRPVRSTRQP